MRCKPLKCVLLGPSGVGKSCLFNSLREVSRSVCEGCIPDFVAVFSMDVFPTLGACTAHLQYKSPEGSIEIWDTAGQERFNVLVPMYIRGADLFLFVATPETPKESLVFWEQLAAEELGVHYSAHCAEKGLPNCVYVVTNQDKHRQVPEWLIKRDFRYVSNMTGHGIHALYESLGDYLIPEMDWDCVHIDKTIVADGIKCC